jgi:nicotinamidase-related amidase
MAATLLLIDPQNDFCDIEGAALPVPGSAADMQRAAQLIAAAGSDIAKIVVTLDSHGTVAIERTTFWRKANGEAVEPFTQITAADVVEQRFLPRDTTLTAEAISYLRALEHSNRYRLMVWPVHCVLGTWGHNIHSSVAAALAQWEERAQHNAIKVLKGMNPMTEQYSAVQAEVPVKADPLTLRNAQLIEHCRPGSGYLLVAGEAASHCVAATMDHLFEALDAQERRRTIILQDCMSPVNGFESHAEQFFERARALGARVMTMVEALQVVKQ